MSLTSFFKKSPKFFGLDIGQSSLKFVELNKVADTFVLEYAETIPFSADVFSNQMLSNSEQIQAAIELLQNNISLTDKKAVIGIPAPSVFTKRLFLPYVDSDGLPEAVETEAANILPQGTHSVRLDYDVTSSIPGDSTEVLLVAVKNEIIDSYIDSVSSSGIQVGIADVDFFALENCFEINYPDYSSKTVALVDIGHRFCSIAVVRENTNKAVGDLTLNSKDSKDIAIDLNRSLSFLWGSLGSDEQIDLILLAGGGANQPGLIEEVQSKTGISCEKFDPFRKISLGEAEFDKGDVSKYSVACGLAIRTYRDKSLEAKK